MRSGMLWKITLKRMLIFILSGLISFFVSCSFFDFKEPVIVEVSPGENAFIADTNDIKKIDIRFDSTMNQYSVKNAVVVKKINKIHFDEQRVDGYFIWDNENKVVSFYPDEGWKFGRYRIEISRKCEDINGNNIHSDTNILFQIGTDITAPELLWSLPADRAENVSNHTDILLVFSEPIDISKINELFTLTPSAQFYIQVLSNQSVFRLIPYYALDQGAYTLEIKNIFDRAGNKMENDLKLTFTVGTDFTAPDLIGMYSNLSSFALVTNQTHQLDKYQNLYFVFSEDIDVDPFNVPISISPLVAGDWSVASNVLIFRPREAMDIDDYYHIQVSGIKDFVGNEMKNEKDYYFQVQSAYSFFLDTVDIRVLTNTLSIGQINELHISNAGSLTNAQNVEMNIRFNSSLQDISVPENVSVSYISGSGELVSPYITELTFSNAIRPNDTISVRIQDLSYFNIYKMSLNGGKNAILDTNQNWLKESRDIYFKIEP